MESATELELLDVKLMDSVPLVMPQLAAVGDVNTSFVCIIGSYEGRDPKNESVVSFRLYNMKIPPNTKVILKLCDVGSHFFHGDVTINDSTYDIREVSYIPASRDLIEKHTK